MTPVLFRKERSGQFKDSITAVFPTLPGSPGCMACYAHIGQHSSCSFEWYASTVPASPFDYEDLLEELKHNVGYDDLKVVKRITGAMRDLRNAAERRVA